MFDIFDLECIVRILISAICGSFIGIERKVRLKEAGTRTHLVVAFGSALFMIVSKYGFEDMIVRAADNPAISFDPTRIASTIVTGIGFLGAGTIFVRRNVINGLTTAAGLWSTAAVGMAIGAGQYIIGISAAVILTFLQWFLHSSKLIARASTTLMIFKLAPCEKPFDKLEKLLNQYGIIVKSVNFEKNSNNECKIECVVKMPAKLSHIELSDELCANDFILGVEF
ncbi:MAG: MgtC/SapB family protein [Ruminococcaceae bacterium]|nr:MgtC/SapB family protein [Oscillospiraceae bacterium]